MITGVNYGGVEVDPQTLLPIDFDPYSNPLSAEHNGCVPGPGIKSAPWLDADAVNFSGKYLRRTR
jgi:hypothetical protein